MAAASEAASGVGLIGRGAGAGAAGAEAVVAEAMGAEMPDAGAAVDVPEAAVVAAAAAAGGLSAAPFHGVGVPSLLRSATVGAVGTVGRTGAVGGTIAVILGPAAVTAISAPAGERRGAPATAWLAAALSPAATGLAGSALLGFAGAGAP
ncbi:MAG: hypothetical protein J0H67_21210, partial [Rhodospirillales bacterium]|nr:hypothetical protein [Rhodospirillales bacterium]